MCSLNLTFNPRAGSGRQCGMQPAQGSHRFGHFSPQVEPCLMTPSEVISINLQDNRDARPAPPGWDGERSPGSAHPLQGGAVRNLGREDLVLYGFLRLDHFLGLAHNLCKHSWSGSVLNHGVWESSSPFVPDLWGRAQGGCVCKCDSLLTCVRVRVHECVLGHVSMRLCIWM